MLVHGAGHEQQLAHNRTNQVRRAPLKDCIKVDTEHRHNQHRFPVCTGHTLGLMVSFLDSRLPMRVGRDARVEGRDLPSPAVHTVFRSPLIHKLQQLHTKPKHARLGVMRHSEKGNQLLPT